MTLAALHALEAGVMVEIASEATGVTPKRPAKGCTWVRAVIAHVTHCADGAVFCVHPEAARKLGGTDAFLVLEGDTFVRMARARRMKSRRDAA